MCARLAVGRVGFKVCGYCPLPLVTIREQFRFVVKQFFACLGRIFKVWSFDHCIHGARFLAETTINALRHINVVARRSATTIVARFALDSDSLRRAYSLAKFACDTPLFPVGIAPQCMLTPETRAQRVFFVRVIYRHLGLEEILQGQGVRLYELPKSERLNEV